MLLQQIQHTNTMIAITQQRLAYNAHHQQQQPTQQCNNQALQWNSAYNAYHQQQQPAPDWNNQAATDNQTMQWSPGLTCGQYQPFYEMYQPMKMAYMQRRNKNARRKNARRENDNRPTWTQQTQWQQPVVQQQQSMQQQQQQWQHAGVTMPTQPQQYDGMGSLPAQQFNDIPAQQQQNQQQQHVGMMMPTWPQHSYEWNAGNN